MFWILRGILELLEASHSFLWFCVNSFAGCCRREENLSAAGTVASKQERCVGREILLVARAGDILSSGLSGDDQWQNLSKNCRCLSRGSALLCVCTFKGGTLLTNLNFQMMI